MAEDKAQSRVPGQPREAGLEARMLGLGLLWGFLDAQDLKEAPAALGSRDATGVISWLEAKGLLTPEQVSEMELEARTVAVPADAAPTSRYRIPDTESLLASGEGGPPSGAYRIPGRPTGATAPDVLVSSSLPAWGPYERLRLIGEGGMARIFRAFDPRLRRPVAIKILRRDDPELLQRFMQEAQSQALVEHEHVCRIFETGDIGGQAYIAMQLIQGETFKASITKLSMREKAELMTQVCEGVHAAHRRGLIHRDLKPANLMVEPDEDGKAKAYVLDFGLARSALAGKGMTATGFVMGTVVYMSPEQARGEVETMDRRADVYALGATFYELLCGCPPYGLAEGMDALRKIIYEEPLPPRKRYAGIPEDLETIILKCLEKDPARRYDTARALGDDLQRWLDGDPIMARPLSRRERLLRLAARNKLAVGIGAGALVAVLLAGGIAINRRLQSAARARWAQHFGQEAERLESLMRYGKLLPPHDIRRERRAVEERMRVMEREIAGAGGIAQGPGAYALGRTWLALGDAAKARGYLQRANEAGFKGPEVNYALGRACGLLYQQELEEAQRIPEPDARKARIRELEQGLKAEALALLKSGRGSDLEPPEFQEGQLALVDGRHEDAIRQARTAFDHAPWFFEAKRLEAEGQLAAARVELDQQVAKVRLQQTVETIETARIIAPSDPAVLELESNRCHALLGLDVRAAADPKSAVTEQVSLCKVWEFVEPQNPKPIVRSAIAAAEMSRFNTHNSALREYWMRLAKRYLEKAQRLESTNTEVLSAGVSLLRIQARQDEQAGKDPIPTLEQAVRLARRARERSPTSVTVNLQLLRSYAVLLGVLIDRGVDLGSTYTEAEKVANELMVRYPDVATYPAAFGLLQVERANADAQKGKDPRPLIADAIPKLELARRLNPQDLAHAYGVANARLVRAEYESTLGRDSGLDIQICKKIYRELTERESAYPHYHIGLVMALELEAREKHRKQLDPRELISEARSRLTRIDQVLPNYWMSNVIRARLDVLEGVCLFKRPHDSKIFFDRAGRNLDQLSRVRPNQPEIKMALKYLEQARIRPG